MDNRQYLRIYLMPLFQLTNILPDNDPLFKITKERALIFLKEYAEEDEVKFKARLEETFGQEVRAAISYVEITRQKSATLSLMFIRIMLILSLIASVIIALSMA